MFGYRHHLTQVIQSYADLRLVRVLYYHFHRLNSTFIDEQTELDQCPFNLVSAAARLYSDHDLWFWLSVIFNEADEGSCPDIICEISQMI